ncbi:hypothetical protein BDF20DRAFT_877752 [Mycotypha africana]|uniref:uncharacterized protein n=1 Tax=Mycotypha africana TaxID=64632 RepID=UPI0023006E4A|nr:uncharacterized protein BDF20DRAFT_877752 [Mycotypha africana]KAI8975285.1 hypothetical protein BDF20DRAFT_877752 [Mycotypha africana]
MPNSHKYEQIPLDNQADDHYSSNYISQPSAPSATTDNNHRQQQHNIIDSQRASLEDAFGPNNDEEEYDEIEHLESAERQHLLPPSPTSISNNIYEDSNTTPSHLPSTGNNNSRIGIQQQSTDGVFSNISAKPDLDSKVEDEVPPTYEEAAADATPPYWQTTVIAPAGVGDFVLVGGLPVGSVLSFIWNLAVSASFQMVGFMLTYLLHTTHAAKEGAKAGLGISLVQYGFYVRSRGSLEENFDYGSGNNDSGSMHNDDNNDAATQADLVAYIMMFLGWFIILRAVSDYTKARKMEQIINSEPTTVSPENMV